VVTQGFQQSLVASLDLVAIYRGERVDQPGQVEKRCQAHVYDRLGRPADRENSEGRTKYGKEH
jgi:hypothetical protein